MPKKPLKYDKGDDGVFTSKRKNGKIYSLKLDKNRFFYPDEYMKFFDMLETKQKHTAKVILNTGARIEEARNIIVEDIDLNNKRLVLRVTKTKAKKGETHGMIRTIPISTEFCKYLKKYIKNERLMAKDNLGLLSNPAFNIAMKKAAKKANLKNPNDFSAHSLRKTLETWLMSLGIQDSALCAHLGHDIRTAVSHYISPDVFSYVEKDKIRIIIGDLYRR